MPKTFAHGYRTAEAPVPAYTIQLSRGEKVTTRPRRKPRSKNFRALPEAAVLSYGPLSVDRNDPDTTFSAFHKRIAGKTAFQDPAILRDIRQFLERKILPLLPKPKVLLTHEEWLSHTSYSEKQKLALRQKISANRGTHPTQRTAQRVSSFIKLESYGEWKIGRLINSRVDDFKVWCGRFFKTIERTLFHSRLARFFVKNLQPWERARRVRELHDRHWKYYYSTDYSSFEKHFTKIVMECLEFPLYRYMLEGLISPSDLGFLFQILSGRNKLRTRSGHKASVNARRMSGEMNTSLGNTFANFLLCAYVMYSKGIGLGGFDAIFEGDDGMIGSNVPLTSEDFQRCGFDIKISQVQNPMEASFCGLIFAESGQTVRDPLRFFENFGWTGSFIHAGPKIMNELLRAKSLSALYETPSCPIISAAARRCLSITRGHNARFVRDGYHDVDLIPRDESKLSAPDVSDDTRVLFGRLFGIPPQEQLRLERDILKGDWSSLAGGLELSARVEPARYRGYCDVRSYSDRYIYSG